jgi:hypothetical protein
MENTEILKELNREDFLENAFPALQQLFLKQEPFGKPFNPKVEHRFILYEYNYVPEYNLLPALFDTAIEYNETGFYVSLLYWDVPEYQDWTTHWFVTFDEYDEIVSKITSFESIIHSPNGLWGIMSTTEEYGLLAASKDFGDSLTHSLPQLTNQVHSMLENWVYKREAYGSDVSWLRDLLTNVYDEETAKLLLKTHGL